MTKSGAQIESAGRRSTPRRALGRGIEMKSKTVTVVTACCRWDRQFGTVAPLLAATLKNPVISTTYLLLLDMHDKPRHIVQFPIQYPLSVPPLRVCGAEDSCVHIFIRLTIRKMLLRSRRSISPLSVLFDFEFKIRINLSELRNIFPYK